MTALRDVAAAHHAELGDLAGNEERDDRDWGVDVVEGEDDAARWGAERAELHELRGDVIESSADLRVGRELGHGALVGAEHSPGDCVVLIGRCDNNRLRRKP